MVARPARAVRFGYFEEMAIIAPGSTVAKNYLGLRLGGAVACLKNRGVFNCFTNDFHIVALILILYGAWNITTSIFLNIGSPSFAGRVTVKIC